jgi:hypothetical protein
MEFQPALQSLEEVVLWTQCGLKMPFTVPISLAANLCLGLIQYLLNLFNLISRMENKSIFFLGLMLILHFPYKVKSQRIEDEETLKTFFSYQPPKKKHRFFKRKFLDSTMKRFGRSGLDTNAVYILKQYFHDEKKTIYSFSRYFSTGEYFSSHGYSSFPTDEQFNDLTYGRWGMFYIDKKNIITVEFYIHENMTHFHYTKSQIEQNGIRCLRYTIGRNIINTYFPCKSFKEKYQVALTDFSTRWRPLYSR